MRMENTILNLWQAIAAQDEEKLASFFTAGAQIVWPNTEECFDLPGYLRANCDYPGQWEGKVEKIAKDGSYSVAKVWSPEGTAARAVTFYQWENGKIVQMTEYWGDIGPAPGWRRELPSCDTVGTDLTS